MAQEALRRLPQAILHVPINLGSSRQITMRISVDDEGEKLEEMISHFCKRHDIQVSDATLSFQEKSFRLVWCQDVTVFLSLLRVGALHTHTHTPSNTPSSFLYLTDNAG